MGLFNADTNKKVTELSEKYEAKKVELQEKRKKLLEDKDALRSAIEDDFQRQIEEGTKADKKLHSDAERVEEELKDVTNLLENIDVVKAKKLSKYVEEIEKERQKALVEANKMMFEFEKEIATLRYAFLDKLAESRKKQGEAEAMLGNFREAERLLNLKPLHFDPSITIITDFRPSHKISPVPNKTEINEAYRNGSYYSARERKHYFGE